MNEKLQSLENTLRDLELEIRLLKSDIEFLESKPQLANLGVGEKLCLVGAGLFAVLGVVLGVVLYL